MRKIVLSLALAPLALAACSSEPAEEAAPEATESAAPAMVTGNGSPAGAYTATTPDGTVTISTLNANGTYFDTDENSVVLAEGNWAVTDGKTCFTPTTAGVEPMCYTEGPAGPDGSFTATGDDGSTVTVAPRTAGAAVAE